MATSWRATMRIHEPTGREFTIQGTGNSEADALGELTAKAALTVGVPYGATMSGPIPSADEPDLNTGPVYSDAVLVLRNGAGDIVSVHLENIAVVYGLGAGQIDLTDPDIIAYATAYRDGQGNGTYAPFAGEYVA